MLNADYDVEQMVDRTLCLVAVAVSPALPLAITCGVIFAIQRLKKQKIFCISPPRLNLAGRVQLFIFDKTGTLTEDGVEMVGY
jgi:cation-transporting ATPase 13A2